MGSDTELFVDLAKQFKAMGYRELNWNLGCPYPMVTKRGFGSALLSKPEQVKVILDAVLPKIEIPLSIKTRLGFEQPDEIEQLIEVLNAYPILELTIHSRTVKQMYKGKASPILFAPLIARSKHALVYNGDLNTVKDIANCNMLFEDRIGAYMLGRGLLMNPFLASELKGETFSMEAKIEVIRDFHSELFELSRSKLESSHLLGRMQAHWEYLSFIFENQHKAFKQIKKAKRIDKYLSVIDELLKI